MAFPIESYAAKIQRKLLKKQRVIEAASGRQKADLVLKNATYVNVFSNESRKRLKQPSIVRSRVVRS